MTIGAIIKQFRHEQDVTQEQLAEALGITSRAVSQWENGRTAPDISQLPALANFFDVTTDYLLGVDIRHKEDELKIIYAQMNKFGEKGDQKGMEEFIREQLKTYPNDPALLTNLAFALQCWYFHLGNADTEELKKEKSDEIIALCERALRYYKPTEDNSFPKQLLIIQYINYLHDKKKAKEIVMSLSNISCSYEMFAGDLYEGKEALKERQEALLWSFTQMMFVMFRDIYRDESYTFEQRIEILDANDAFIRLITGEEPNFYNEKLKDNAMSRAWCLLSLGENDNALDMLEKAYEYADRFENRPDIMHYTPCWLSEIVETHENYTKTGTDTNYDELLRFITKPDNKFCETFKGNERFEKLLEKLKEKISK